MTCQEQPGATRPPSLRSVFPEYHRAGAHRGVMRGDADPPYSYPTKGASMAKKTDRHVIRDQNGAILGINWVKVLGKPCSDAHAMAMSDGVPIDCPLCG